jgi:gas vesicle protein
MSDRGNNDFGSFVSGVLLGGLIGSAVALLMAPQSGEETREYLKEKGTEFKEMTNESLDAAYARAESIAKDARVRADELSGQVRERADELRGKGQEVLEEQRNRIENVIDAAKTPPKAKKSNSSSDKAESKKKSK